MNLHSNMFLLRLSVLLNRVHPYYHLHSNMFLLRRLSVLIADDVLRHLHSNMFLLRLRLRKKTRSLRAFTFQYVSIKTY